MHLSLPLGSSRDDDVREGLLAGGEFSYPCSVELQKERFIAVVHRWWTRLSRCASNKSSYAGK